MIEGFTTFDVAVLKRRNEKMTDNVNIGASEGEEFDISQIPESVLKSIQSEAREGTIPKERYDKSVGKLKDRLSALESKPAEPTPAARTYTRAQLQSGVDEGTITQEVMDNQLQAQMTDQARAAATEVVSQSQEQSKSQKIIDDYCDVLPDITEEGSDNRQLVADALEDVTEVFGTAKNPAEKRKFEAMALKQAFGPLKNLKQRTKDISNKARASHDEVGGDGNGESKGSSAETKGLSQRVINHNQRFIDNGSKTWKDVRDELKYVKNPNVRERLGIKD